MGAEREKELEREVQKLRAQIQNMRLGYERLEAAFREQRLKPGVRAVIRILHERARDMNDPRCKMFCNNLASDLGWYLRDGMISLKDALDNTILAQLMGVDQDPK